MTAQLAANGKSLAALALNNVANDEGNCLAIYWWLRGLPDQNTPGEARPGQVGDSSMDSISVCGRNRKINCSTGLAARWWWTCSNCNYCKYIVFNFVIGLRIAIWLMILYVSHGKAASPLNMLAVHLHVCGLCLLKVDHVFDVFTGHLLAQPQTRPLPQQQIFALFHFCGKVS